MFDIQNYNILLAFGAFIVIFLFLFLFFKNKSMGIIDPLTMHLLWLSGNLSFLVTYIDKCGLDYIVVLFILVFIIYIYVLSYFLKPVKYQCAPQDIEILNSRKIHILYFASLSLLLFGKKPMFDFFISNNVLSWFLYRYVAIEGGSPFFRMLETGVTPIFLYLTFYNIHIAKKLKKLSLVMLVFYGLISILAGGRSFLLSLIFTYGGFVAFHRGSFLKKKALNNINKAGGIFILLAMLLAMAVSSMYKSDATIEDGAKIILNRVIATADGMEYYIKYDGIEKLPSGGYDYVMSIFGVYLKRILGVEHKNVGHQLSELATGGSLDFAQGSNYTLPLQVMVLGYILMPFYVLIIGFICAKMRNIKAGGTGNLQPISFFFFTQCFTLATDPEFFTLNVISFYLIYYLVFHWLIKIKI